MKKHPLSNSKLVCQMPVTATQRRWWGGFGQVFEAGTEMSAPDRPARPAWPMQAQPDANRILWLPFTIARGEWRVELCADGRL